MEPGREVRYRLDALDAEQKLNAALTIKVATMGSALRRVRDAVVNA